MFDYLSNTIGLSGSAYKSHYINSISDVLSIGLNIMLGSAIAISLIAIILSGIKIMTSKGDMKAKAGAQSALTNSVIAMILTIGALTAKIVVLNILGSSNGDAVRNAVPGF